MTLRQTVFDYLDHAPEGIVSGWQIQEDIQRITGRRPYPETVLKSCRIWADIGGGKFECVDNQTSKYYLQRGEKVAGAILD